MGFTVTTSSLIRDYNNFSFRGSDLDQSKIAADWHLSEKKKKRKKKRTMKSETSSVK